MNSDILSDLGRDLLLGSLSDRAILEKTGAAETVQILPDATVVKIGGQSFIDRGRAAVFPLVDEIAENLGKHKMIIGTGAGTRARHAYSQDKPNQLELCLLEGAKTVRRKPFYMNI